MISVDAYVVPQLVCGATHFLLFIVSAVQLGRVVHFERERRKLQLESAPEASLNYAGQKARGGRKLFFSVIGVFMLVRSTFFLTEPWINEGDVPLPISIVFIWIAAGDALYFLAYFMLLLFWATFYYKLSGTGPTDLLKQNSSIACAFITMALLFAAFVAVAVWLMHSPAMASRFDTIISTIMSGFSLIVAVGFLYFGTRLLMLRARVPPGNTKKRAQILKITGVAGVCTVCFLARTALIMYSVVNTWLHPLPDATPKSSHDVFGVSWIWLWAYFFVTEALPVALMLFLLRKVPTLRRNKKKVVSAPEATPLMAPTSLERAALFTSAVFLR
eukprot:TRINITY_DN1579_c0_g2_i1.p1 TRINITY_DN1579_c0_g2~~TRINITY_DN1579_c0_g2_i1.p1  ORF type:complete len:331 (-),score=85.18 TRINITY_DN1579_c0_g2_i1:1162-2154(-)